MQRSTASERSRASRSALVLIGVIGVRYYTTNTDTSLRHHYYYDCYDCDLLLSLLLLPQLLLLRHLGDLLCDLHLAVVAIGGDVHEAVIPRVAVAVAAATIAAAASATVVASAAAAAVASTRQE